MRKIIVVGFLSLLLIGCQNDSSLTSKETKAIEKELALKVEKKMQELETKYPNDEDIEEVLWDSRNDEDEWTKAQTIYGDDIEEKYSDGYLADCYGCEVSSLQAGQVLRIEHQDEGRHAIENELYMLRKDRYEPDYPYSNADGYREAARQFLPLTDFMTTQEGFKDFNGYRIGYETVDVERDYKEERYLTKEGTVVLYVRLMVYHPKPKLATTFQSEINELSVAIDGVTAKPFFTKEREAGIKKLNMEDSIVNEKNMEFNYNGKNPENFNLSSNAYRNVSSLFDSANWEEENFNTAVIYPGTIVPVLFQLELERSFFDTLTFNEEGSALNGLPEELTLCYDEDEVSLLGREQATHLIDDVDQWLQVRP